MKSRIYIYSNFRNIALINLFLIIFSSSFYSQTLSYLKTYDNIAPGNWYMQYPYIDTLNQNSYIHSGFLENLNSTSSDTLSSSSTFFSKNSVNGNIQWIRTYKANSATTCFKNFCVLNNKEIITCGYLGDPYDLSLYRGLLMKLDTIGNVIWSKQIPNLQFNTVNPISNNSFVFAAIDSVYPYWTNIIGKVTNTGNVLWSKRIGDNFQFSQYGVKLVENTNGDILLVGFRMNIAGREAVAVLFDSLGNKKNEIIIAPTSTDAYTYFTNVCLDKTGGYMIIGEGPGIEPYAGGPMIVRTDANLNLKWKNHYYTTSIISEILDISSLNNNKFIILTEPEGHGNNPGGYLKRVGFSTIDSNGVFSNSFLITKDSVDHMPTNFQVLNSGKILFTGSTAQKIFYGMTDTSSTGFCGYKDISFINFNPSITFKTGMQVNPVNLIFTNVNIYTSNFNDVLEVDDCQLFLNVFENNDENELEIFPIPANNSLFIKSSEQKNYIENVNLYDNLGQIVKTTLFRQDLNLIKLNFVTKPGIYYLKVNFSNGDLKTKMILVN